MKQSEEVGQLKSSKELKNIFEGSFSQQLIDEEIVHAFGYGSGVFSQQQQQDDGDNKTVTDLNTQQKTSKSEKEERKMLDMILIIKDATRFHSLNQQLNPHHYAPLFRTSQTRAAWWQQGHVLPKSMFGINPGVFFNFVDDAKCWMKYGVITRDDLAADLMNWDSLYVGGRLHKPTATIHTSQRDSNDTDGVSGGMDILRLQQKHNLPAAVSIALLLASASDSTRNHNSATPITSSSLSLSELYSRISGLSYTGDFRMQMGAEDPGKINKLVHSPGQLARFHALYYETAVTPLLETGIITSSSPSLLDTLRLTWNPNDPSVVNHLWRQLPPRFQSLPQAPATPSRLANGSSQTKVVISDKDLQSMRRALNQELHKIVAPAARYQSFKGLWTAGIGKSAKYAFAKLSKGILRRR